MRSKRALAVGRVLILDECLRGLARWVEEDSEPRPLERKAVARREAEESWLWFGDEAGVCIHVFHLGGIYGPGRSKVPHQGAG
jgi:nucleoside-diphosphate-sugar epimerase